jgi:hypothetical protein
MWNTKYPNEYEPSKGHYHCLHPQCFSKGVLLEDPAFTCAYAYEATRHENAHKRRTAQEFKDDGASYRRLYARSKIVNRKVNKSKQTEFRQNINKSAPQQQAPGCIHWSSRLTTGKVGPTASILVAAIEHVGTNPRQKLLTSPVRPQAVQGQEFPVPGQTIKFHEVQGISDRWYGICCGQTTTVDVFGDVGPGCAVRWFDVSHRGTWRGGEATFYELLEWEQPQLIESMHSWGHMFVYDQPTSMFVVPDEGALHDKYMRDFTGDPLAGIREYVNSGAHTEQAFTKEDQIVLRALFPTRLCTSSTRLANQPTRSNVTKA